MEGGSEGENRDKDDGEMNNSGGIKAVHHNNSNEGQSKPKRQMKTPFQLETLEKAYVLDAYPSESIRADLSEKLGLSDRQLQMWFCHRRLKDKKDGGPAKKQRKLAPAQLPESSPIHELRVGPPSAGPGSDYGSGSGSGSSPFGPNEFRNVMAGGRYADDMPPAGRRYYEPPLPLLTPPLPPARPSIMERAVTIVEAQLGEPLRENGPVLGVEFDPLPPDAFGAPIAAPEHHKRSGNRFEHKSYDLHEARANKTSQRAMLEYPFLQEAPSARSNAYGLVSQSHHSPGLDGPTTRILAVGNEQLPRTQSHSARVRVSQPEKQGVAFSALPLDPNTVPSKDHSFANVRASPQISEHPIISPESSYMVAEGQVYSNETLLRMERKRKNEEARIAREAEAHELRVRKELEKQDILRRKHEERMRKEGERLDRERRKEEERLMREKQREEERVKREQRREIERREKFMQKECLRAEKRKIKEELRREREEVRRKAAIEKATARRIARESMELIEDEQLELMEMAAVRKGLPSIIALDHETMQSLESFKNFLGAFPPKSVQLKRPFSIQPWNHSEENIGNLFMVWRFLITFADVLELWPFTLDEFVQAFHDYDSRLLGEIHVALLKLIIKDIEDVARTPSGLGMNQNGAANPGGGHPEIVEGAYTWGFDICNWQRLLNPLTWPEVFRQLALSAGFGPRLKKRSTTWPYSRDDNNEGKSCEDVISTLRSGSAAENAFTVMQEKGLLNPRKSRHRLTPGTVKFAAFHVLSLEGNKGLTVLDLAEKIQKSGLRDLTTSKTPEASISVALTRDAKLFERIAPSTYRVRAAYRKDPGDAEAILSAARKKVQVFENGFLAAEDADDVERDDDSECDDVDEDPEVDDLVTPSRPTTIVEHFHEGSVKENLSNDVMALDLHNEFDKDSSVVLSGVGKDVSFPVATSDQFAALENTNTTISSYPDEENMEIDESKSGESWIQGLTEGDYSDISVEERLNALVRLVGIANEGNSVRLVLEDRLEAANSLKKQMWTEAQLDKIRLKEESVTRYDFSSSAGVKSEMQFPRPGAEGSHSPLPDAVNRITDMSPSTVEAKKPIHDLNTVLQPDLNCLPSEKTPLGHDLSAGPDSILTQQFAFASKRSRSQLKSYIAHRAEEMYVYRSLPLGQDRRHNRYWQFVASASKNDPGSGRVFVELKGGNWRLIDTEEAFDALLMSLDTRGIRESHLRVMLQKIETSFKENLRRSDRGSTDVKRETAETKYSPPGFPISFDSPGSTICGSNSDLDSVETSSSFRIELGRNETEKRASLRRYQDFQKWVWRECLNSSALRAMKHREKRSSELLDICDICLSSYYCEDLHCSSCHLTFGNNFVFSQHVFQCEQKRKSDPPANFHYSDTSLPFGSRLLKALLARIEASVPPEALQSFWTEDHRKIWGVKLNDSLTSEQLLQILTRFESVMKRDFLGSRFAPTEEVLGSSSNQSDPGSAPLLPWVPHTSAAVALRLFELDASVAYVPEEKPDPIDDRAFGEYIKASARFAPERDIEMGEMGYNNEYVKEETLSQMKSSRNNLGRGRGGSREQGRVKGKLRKKDNKVSKSRRNAKKSNANKASQALSLQRAALKQGGARGPRTIRKRRPETKAVEEEEEERLLQVPMADTPSSSPAESPRNLEEEEEEEEWDDEIEIENENTTSSPMRHNDRHIIAGEEEEEEEEEDEEERVGLESDDNARELEEEEEEEEDDYGRGNWEVGFNGVPSSSKWDGASEEDDVDGYDDDDDNGVGIGVGDRDRDRDIDTVRDRDSDVSEESDEELPDDRMGNDDVAHHDKGFDSSPSEDDYSD